jgi:hypothetical protein
VVQGTSKRQRGKEGTESLLLLSPFHFRLSEGGQALPIKSEFSHKIMLKPIFEFLLCYTRKREIGFKNLRISQKLLDKRKKLH